MIKKFFSAIAIAFAFLFLNVSLNYNNANAQELPDEILANAGIGEKLGYWAIVNYGADYVSGPSNGTDNVVVTIDIEQEAIANEDINSIAIVESGHQEEVVHYERNINKQFSSKIVYSLKNKDYEEKYITILLLREFSYNPTENSIVDKIHVKINQKRSIDELLPDGNSDPNNYIPEEILAIKETMQAGANPYKINVTLPNVIERLSSTIDDYAIKSVKYTWLKGNNTTTLNALYESLNNFYFTVDKNGEYLIEIEDVFGAKQTKLISVDNLKTASIIIEAKPSVTKPTNSPYTMDICVFYYIEDKTDYDCTNRLNSGDLESLEYSFNDGGFTSILENQQIIIRENGVYTIRAVERYGARADLIVQIENIDTEAPFVQVLDIINVYSENAKNGLFDASKEIFVYDNVSTVETISVEYEYDLVEKNPGEETNKNYKAQGCEQCLYYEAYLYNLRDLYIYYTVRDEAGNTVEATVYVHAVDNSIPTIEKTAVRKDFYINDPYPTAQEVESAYGLKVQDNSIYEGSKWTIQYILDFSNLPVDANNKLNMLGLYNIYVSAVDEAGNASPEISLVAEVRQRLIRVEADFDQYIIYGDKKANEIKISYHCVTKDGEIVTCESQMLENDKIIGELYVLNATYVGKYEIYYDNIQIPSKLYYLEYGNENVFEIKKRVIPVLAHDKTKSYLDEDPELTYEIDERYCDPTDELYNKDFRCSYAPDTTDKLAGLLERYKGEPLPGITIWHNEEIMNDPVLLKQYQSEAVWFDGDGNLAARSINQGTLDVLERYNGGIDNYDIFFIKANFIISPKHIEVDLENASKIYGEEDPIYKLAQCRGGNPINGATLEFCAKELDITIYRKVEGETVKTDASGNYVDYYVIGATYGNLNYIVQFKEAYLTILRRDISISVNGDLDQNGNPTGIYTIYYEDNIPMVTVYDSSKGEKTGLVNNPNLGIADKFSSAIATIYTQDGTLVEEYVNGIGTYIIKKGNIKILDKDDNDTEYNYNITFNDGILEVIKKEIWIKIIKDLTKIYGDEDRIFTDSDLASYDDYVILEAMGRFIIEIRPTTVPGEDPYIPRDNEKMKYYLSREEGIYVGDYPISIEKLENCENYSVQLYKNYVYTITRRSLLITIEDKEITYREPIMEFTYKEGEWVDNVQIRSNLQYSDYLTGSPSVENAKNVGVYPIRIGDIKVVDQTGQKDVSFNYDISVIEGKLNIVQRVVEFFALEGQKKEYGDYNPSEYKFVVHYKGVEEEMSRDDYTGVLGREFGEVPGDYSINIGSFKLKENGQINGEPISNYVITNFNFDYPFTIEKRKITITANSVNVMYGNPYQQDIFPITSRSRLATSRLAMDEEKDTLNIINDYIEGELKIIGNVDGVGTYTISTQDLRIKRSYNGEDVTTLYYDCELIDGVLTIYERTLYIYPVDGQFKTYGENEPHLEFTYEPNLIDDGDEFIGNLGRVPLVEGNWDESVGTYKIVKGTLDVKTPSGKPNYELIVMGEHYFVINKRNLTLEASNIEIEYGDPYSLDWSTVKIKEGSLAKNDVFEDKITGSLKLDPDYHGVGVYNIEDDSLIWENNLGFSSEEIKENYNYRFISGKLIVNKKKLVVTPDTVYKVYGDEDPKFTFTTNLITPPAYTGILVRDPGENVGKYAIYPGENFKFVGEENYDIVIESAYLEILARRIKVTANDSEKIFGQADPKFTYTYEGTIIEGDDFFGALSREPAGESVGEYRIIQGSLGINNVSTPNVKSPNYIIDYVPGIFIIKYAEFTSITIHLTTNNQHQVKGDKPELVIAYARFNPGADESDIGNVKWAIVKNEEIEYKQVNILNPESEDYEFYKDPMTHEVSFYTKGSIGTYLISATYKGVTAYFEVYVEQSNVGNFTIRYVSGEVNQILGKKYDNNENRMVYRVIVSDDTSKDATVQWLINNTVIKSNKISENIYFDYTPTREAGAMTYKVEAKIGNKVSEPLYFYVKNNNPPIITLKGEPVEYVEARAGKKYIDAGATVIDDIDGDITAEKLVITGLESINENEKGIYYIRYDATDKDGNKAISVFRQVVVRDTIAPVVTINGNRKIKLLYGQQYVDLGATAVDNYDGEVEVIVNNPVVTTRIGIYEVTYVAYDSSGNRGVAIRSVEVIDNISPVITLIGDEVVNVEVYGKFEDDGALIEDNVDGTFVMLASSFAYKDTDLNKTIPVDRIDTSKIGTYYAYYDYKDTAGNVGAGKIRTVIVKDSTPPVITLNGMNPYIIRYSYPQINFEDPWAVAKDNYDKFVEVTRTGQIGNELGRYYLYYDAVDSHGNPAKRVTREVIVVDIENPIIHFKDCPQYMTIEALYEEYDTRCDAPGFGLWIEDDYMADLEELQKRIVVTGEVDNTTVGLYIIKYDVKDMAGNSAVTVRRYVEVVDTTAPTITLKCEDGNACREDTSQTVEVFTGFEDWGAIVYDRYDQYHNIEINVMVSHDVNIMILGTYTITYTARDSNGNVAEPVIRKVYVKDTTPPEITIIGANPMTIERGNPYVEYSVIVIDNYDGPMNSERVLRYNVPSGMKWGHYDVTYKIKDSSGNEGVAIRKVFVDDTIPPVVLGVEDGKYYKDPVTIHFVPTLNTDEVLTGWLNGEEIQTRHFVEEEGDYELVVKDDRDNTTTIKFYIDNTPPLILGVQDGEHTNKDVVEITTNEGPKIKYFQYRYNSGEWIKVEDKESVKFDLEGIYHIYAVDRAENVSKETTFVIDRTSPIYSLTGVLNKGITDTNVGLVTEENAIVAVNSQYNIPTLYNFTQEGYYQVVIRDLAGNAERVQFVINKSKNIIVSEKLVSILSQHNAIDKISIAGSHYPRNSGVLIAKPLLEGGYEYVSGKLFSESEYQALQSGRTVELKVSSTDDTYMLVAFVVEADELNKFGSQTVEGDDPENDDGEFVYSAMFFVALALVIFLFIFFLKRRKKQEEEDEEEETIEDIY